MHSKFGASQRNRDGDIVYYANTVVVMHQADQQILNHDDSAYRALCTFDGVGVKTITSAPYNIG